MKKGVAQLILLALFLLLAAVEVWSQEPSTITVRKSAVNNGVVILDILKTGKAYELQCNQGAPGCTALKSGQYQMIELPKNFGMYDCKDVEVYPYSVVDPDKDKKLVRVLSGGKVTSPARHAGLGSTPRPFS